jgi:hypothetical protein
MTIEYKTLPKWHQPQQEMDPRIPLKAGIQQQYKPPFNIQEAFPSQNSTSSLTPVS